MFKIALCSDLHWCKNSSIIRRRGKKYTSRLENCIDTMNWFESMAKSENCDAEYFLGDTFDRASMDAEEITAIKDVNWNDIEKHFIVGNHESDVASLSFSTTSVFQSSFDVISSNTKRSINEFVDLFCIPYITTDKPILLSDIISGDKKKIVFTHNDLSGVRYGPIMSTSGFDIEDAAKCCTLMFNGHLHNGGVYNDRIYVVGNITGQNFNEDALKYSHLAYIITIDNDGSISVESRENPFAFNFYKLYFSSSADLRQIDKLKNNAIVSAICDNNLLEEVGNKLRNNTCVSEFRVISKCNRTEDTDTFEFTEEDHIKQFISFASQKLEYSKLLEEELALLGG